MEFIVVGGAAQAWIRRDAEEEQPQILRLTTPRLKSTPGAPFAQDDSAF
jgi:hypothetical protein